MPDDPPAPTADAGAATIPPLHTLSFPQGKSVQSVALSPEGTTAYANIHVMMFDFGAAAQSVLPPVGGTISTLLVLIAAVLTVKVVKRRRQRGLPYCNRCNYCLDGLGSGTQVCPECGADLTKKSPAMGQTTVRRLRPAMFLVGIALTLAAIALLAWRQAFSCRSLGWRSQGVAQWLESKPWRTRFPRTWWTQGEVVLAVDTTTGSWRVVAERADATYFDLALTPTGDGIYLQSEDREGVDVVSTTDGHTLAILKCKQDIDLGVNTRAIIGHSQDGTETWLSAATGQTTKKSVLIRWNRVTGTWNIAASRDSYAGSWPAHFILAPQSTGLLCASFPDFMESFPTKQFIVNLYGASGSVVSTVDLGPNIATHATPLVFTPDGKFLIAGGNYMQPVLLSFDTAALVRGEVKPTTLLAAPGHNDISRLTIPFKRPDVLLYEQFEAVHVARHADGRTQFLLTLSPGLYGVQPVISDDGRWVAATAQRGGTNGVGWSHDLLIWQVPATP